MISAPVTTVAFTTDANSGIGTASQYGSSGYTHALAFNTSGLTVNGLAFNNGSQSGTNYSTSNWANNFTTGSFAGAGTSTNTLLGNFIYGPGGNGSVQTLTVTGLTPGSLYDARVYYRNFDTVGTSRAANWTFNSGSGVTTSVFANEDANATGNYIDIPYQVGASGTLVLSATDTSGNSWHMYGFTNQLVSAIAGSNLLPTTTALQIKTGATLDLSGVSQTVASLADGSGGGGAIINSAGLLPVTFTINPASGSTAFSGTISDSGSSNAVTLAKTGAGTQVLTGANTYSGATTINGGTLQLGDGTSGHDGSLATSSVVDNSALVYNIFGTQTPAFAISGTGSLTKQGAGSLTLIAAKTYTGATTISAGTLLLGDGTSGHDGSLTTSSIANNGVLVYNIVGAQSGAYPITGTGTLTKQGAGTLSLSGASSYSGGTTVNNGIISFGKSSLGTGPIAFTGGSLQFATGNTQEISNIRNSTTAVSIDTNGNVASSSVIDSTNVAGLIKNGSGALVLLGSQTYGGSTSVNGGTLRLAPATSALSIVNPGFETPAFGANGWSYGPTGAGVGWTLPPTYSGIARNGSPWVTTAPEGVQVGFVQNTTTMTQSISVGTTGYYDVSFQAANRPTYSASDLALQIDGVTVGTWAAATINNGAVFKSFTVSGIPLSAGSHILGFAGTQSRPADSATAIDSVVASGYAAGLLPATTALSISNGGTFDVNGNSQTVASLTGVAGSQVLLTGSGALTTGGDNSDWTFAGTFGGSGTLTKTGAGTLTLTGASTHTGPTVVSGGTLRIGDGTIGHDGSLTTSGVTNNAGVTYNLFGNQSVSYPITGSGTLRKQGAGTLTISGPGMGFTGATTISGGRLQLEGASAAAPATSAIAVNAGGTLGFTSAAASTMTLGGAMTLGGGTVNFDIGSAGVNDAINVNSLTLTANSGFTFNAIGAIDSTSTYTLLTSTSAINASSFTIAGQTVGKLVLSPVINSNSITLTPVLQQAIWNIATGGDIGARTAQLAQLHAERRRRRRLVWYGNHRAGDDQSSMHRKPSVFLL